MNNRGELPNGLPLDDQSGGGDSEPRPNGLDRAAELKFLDAASLGDMQAFSEVFEHYRPDLYALCLQRLSDPSLAEDVVQEVFLKAFASLPNSDHRRPIWPWLSTIAYRMCVDLQRRRALTHYSGDIGVSVDAGSNGHTESALDAVIASEDRAEFWKSLDVLPERQRRVFLSYALDDLSCAEIAAAEGISLGSVHLLLFRARKKMRSVYPSGRPLPAIVLPFSWLGWKFQRIGERVRPLLGVYGEGFSAACVQAVCLSAVVMMVVATGNSTEPAYGNGVARSDETTVLAAQSQPLQTASLRTVLPYTGPPAKAPVESQESVADPASSLVGDVINPNQNATPESASFGSVTISPNYESDHTMLAAGLFNGNRVLFVSNDGGGTWQPRPSRLLNGSSLILPPDFPKDRRIFALGGGLGLQQSDDGGEIFRTVSPISGGSAAISPSFGEGVAKILLGGDRIFEFDTGTGLTQPALLNIPLGTRDYLAPYVAYSPGYLSDSTIFVFSPTTLYRCKGSICDNVKNPYPGVLKLRFAPQCDQNLTYAFTPWNLLVSNDGAQTFAEVPFPLEFPPPYSDSRSIYDVAILCNASSGATIFASAIDNYSSPQFSSGIYRSLDAGRSWSRASIDLPGFSFGSANGVAWKLTVTPTGRLLATGMSRGIACSEDLGVTWRSRCPPER